jgi:hypothetical protein
MTLTRSLAAGVAVLMIAQVRGDFPRYDAAAKPWDGALGSHRAVVRVDSPAEAVRVRLDWRRRDHKPESKAVIVIESGTGRRVLNARVVNISNESGVVVFQPPAAGEYLVYYLAVRLSGGAFPVSHYQPPDDKADPTWKERAGLTDGRWKSLPAASVVRW